MHEKVFVEVHEVSGYMNSVAINMNMESRSDFKFTEGALVSQDASAASSVRKTGGSSPGATTGPPSQSVLLTRGATLPLCWCRCSYRCLGLAAKVSNPAEWECGPSRRFAIMQTRVSFRRERHVAVATCPARQSETVWAFGWFQMETNDERTDGLEV